MKCKVCGHAEHEGSCLDCPECNVELEDDETYSRLLHLEERVAEIEDEILPLLLAKKKRRDYMKLYMRKQRATVVL